MLRIFREVFGRIFALYALLAFALTITLVALFLLPLSLIREEHKRTLAVMRLYRIWMAVYLPMIGCPVKSSGRSVFSQDKPVIVLFNHNAFIDVLVSTTQVPGAHKTLAKKELASIPIFGLVYRSGSILVDRKDPGSRKKSISAMKETLDKGLSLILYPEGTRNRSGEPLKPFFDGAFSLALETGTPLVPALIFNTRKILPPEKKFFALPHRIRIQFLDPIPTDGLGRQDLETLKKETFRRMKDYYVSHG